MTYAAVAVVAQGLEAWFKGLTMLLSSQVLNSLSFGERMGSSLIFKTAQDNFLSIYQLHNFYFFSSLKYTDAQHSALPVYTVLGYLPSSDYCLCGVSCLVPMSMQVF